jgi:hypothetical protein
MIAQFRQISPVGEIEALPLAVLRMNLLWQPAERHSREARFRPFGILVFSVWLLGNTQGCNYWHHEAATPGFMPSWVEARQSLEAALTAWRDSPSPLPSTLSTRSVQFVDKRRRPNQRLLAYEILGQLDIENARQFTVRLTLEGEESPQLVKYNIVGRDPVWVFRLEDYEMFSHWEHDMDQPASESVEKSKNEQIK